MAEFGWFAAKLSLLVASKCDTATDTDRLGDLSVGRLEGGGCAMLMGEGRVASEMERDISGSAQVLRTTSPTLDPSPSMLVVMSVVDRLLKSSWERLAGGIEMVTYKTKENSNNLMRNHIYV